MKKKTEHGHKRQPLHLWQKYSLYFSTQEQIEGSLSMEEQAQANQEMDELLEAPYMYEEII